MNVTLRDNPKYNLWLVLALLVAVYLVTNMGLVYFGSTILAVNARPIIWGLVAWAVLTFPQHRPLAKTRLKGSFVQLALMVGVLQIIALAIGGLFYGFGRTSVSFAPTAIIQNLFILILTLAGMEISRAWLVKRLAQHHIFLALALVSLLYTFLSSEVASLISPRGPSGMVVYLMSRMFPLFAENLLASCVALLAGPLAAIAYLAPLQAFWMFSPVLPALTAVPRGLIGTLVPIVGMVMVSWFYSARAQRGKPRRAREGSMTGWVATSIVAVAIIWFSVGLFPFQPVLVGSGSMQPAMHVGDVVIVAKVPSDKIEPGDIIQYREAEGITTVHRVIEIQEIEGKRVFVTQGDANRRPDANPVLPANVVGKVVLNIPKVGWAAIVVKGFFTGG